MSLQPNAFFYPNIFFGVIDERAGFKGFYYKNKKQNENKPLSFFLFSFLAFFLGGFLYIFLAGFL